MGLKTFENQKTFTKNSVGANGYDLVSYFSETPELGLEEHLGEYGGVKYYFASASNMEAFKKEPKKYLPVYGGYCAYAMANRGELMSSNPEMYEIQDGKLYFVL